MSTELIPIVGMHQPGKYCVTAPLPEPLWQGKIDIHQWQRDALVDVLKRNITTLEEWQNLWAFIRAHFQVIPLEKKGEDIKDVYVFFGYKKDAAKYRAQHDIDPRDMVVARNYEMLVGRRARPIRLNEDSEWYWLNWDHNHSVQARYEMAVMEAHYGSAE